MKKLLLLFAAFISINATSQTSTWDGGGANALWSNPVNWVGDVLPIDGDDILFNAGALPCTIDVPIVATNFSIMAGYTGVITGSANDIVVGGNFTQAGATFISSSGTFFFTNPNTGTNNTLSKTGGIFTHNGGVVDLSATEAASVTISGTFTFNTLNLSVTNIFSNGQRMFNFGTTSQAANMTISGSKPFGYTGTITLTSSLANSNTSATLPTGSTATFSLTGTAPFTLSGPVSAGQGYLPNITFNTSQVPAMSGNINITGTWNNILSGNLANTGNSTVNFYGATSAIVSHTLSPTTVTRRAKFHNLTIQAGSTVSMGLRVWAEVAKNLTINGALNTTTSTGIHFDGPAATTQNLGGSASGLTIGNILKANTTSTVVLGFALNVMDSIKFAGTSGRINTNGNILTLKSSETLKARIARMGNAGGTAVSSMIGNITVETFAKGGSTGWTNLGVSGVNGNTIANWDGQFPMTCNGCTNGTTTAGGPFASICFYNETLSGGNEYVTANSTDAISPGKGLWVYLGTGLSTTGNITYNVTGAATQGSVTVPVTLTGASANPGFNLVANPYASPISWTRMRTIGSNSINLGPSIHVYNPDLAVTSTFNGQTGFTTGGAGAANCIPMGQGFYVESLVASTNLVFADPVKTHSNTTNFQLMKSSSSNALEPGDTLEEQPVADVFDRGDYFRLKITGFNGDMDDAIVHFHDNAQSGYDIYDTRKMFYSPGYVGYPGPYNKYTTISTKDGNDDYSVNSIKPSASVGYQIPVLVKVMQTGNYTIEPLELNNFPANVCLNLYDKLLNVNHDLHTGAYNCIISDTTSVPRFVLTICPAIITSIDNQAASFSNLVAINKDAKGVFVDFDFEKATNANITVTNILGQTIMSTKQVKASKDKIYLDLNTTEQLIFVTVETENEKVTKKFLNYN